MQPRLARILRTLTSEIYMIWDEERRIGQVDVHYAGSIIQVTVVLQPDVSEEAEAALVAQIDREIVSSHLQDLERDDMLVTVFRGTETGSYSDPLFDEDEDLPDLRLE